MEPIAIRWSKPKMTLAAAFVSLMAVGGGAMAVLGNLDKPDDAEKQCKARTTGGICFAIFAPLAWRCWRRALDREPALLIDAEGVTYRGGCGPLQLGWSEIASVETRRVKRNAVIAIGLVDAPATLARLGTRARIAAKLRRCLFLPPITFSAFGLEASREDIVAALEAGRQLRAEKLRA